MVTVVILIHLFLAIALVVTVLLQRSEGGGLGIGGGGAAMGGLMTSRGTANLLTRATAILAGFFMVTSLTLALLGGGRSQPQSVVEEVPVEAPAPALADDLLIVPRGE